MRRSELLVVGVSLVLGATRVWAEVPPQRQPGLWEIVVQTKGEAERRTVKQCIDQATDAKLINMEGALNAGMQSPCRRAELSKVSDGFESLSDCVVGRTRVLSKGLLKGDLAKVYAGEISTSFDPPFLGIKDRQFQVKATWVGPCPADMKVGDMVISTGSKMNVLDLDAQSRAAQAAQAFALQRKLAGVGNLNVVRNRPNNPASPEGAPAHPPAGGPAVQPPPLGVQR